MSLRLMGASVCQTSMKLEGRPSFCDTPIHSIGFWSPIRFIQKSAEDSVCAWSFGIGLALPSGCQEYCSALRSRTTLSSHSSASPNCRRSMVEFFIGVPPTASPILARGVDATSRRMRLAEALYRPATLLSGPAEAEHHLGDAPHLDLLRSLRNPVPPVVPVDVLEGHMPRVADAAVHLDRLVRRVTDQPVRAVVAHRHLVADLHVVLMV